MTFNKNLQGQRRSRSRRVLIGETLEEEAARLEREIAAHPVTRCPSAERSASASRPGWSSKPIMPMAERLVAEEIATKMVRGAKRKP
jgi:hypothetical protein